MQNASSPFQIKLRKKFEDGEMKFIFLALFFLSLPFLEIESRKEFLERIDESSLISGYWLVFVIGEKCSNCTKVKKILSKIGAEFHPQIRFGHLSGSETKQYGVNSKSDNGKLIFFPNQGSKRYIPCNVEFTAKDIKFFLRNYLAEDAKSQSKIDLAVEEFNRALSHRPASAMVHYNLALLHHHHKRDLVTAARHYDQALADETALPSTAQAHYMAGNAQLMLGYLEKARRHYATAVRANPTLHGAHREAAIAAGMQGDADAAEAALRRAIAIRPEDPDCLADLASLLLDRSRAHTHTHTLTHARTHARARV